MRIRSLSPPSFLDLTFPLFSILLFYILGVFITGLLVPSNDPRLNLADGTAASAPFVIAIQNAGIKALPSIINACLLSSAWSAASSDLYTSSRALYGLALQGQAPALLKKTTSWGLPWVAVLVGVAFSFLSFMSIGSTSAGEVFGYFANMTCVPSPDDARQPVLISCPLQVGMWLDHLGRYFLHVHQVAPCA